MSGSQERLDYPPDLAGELQRLGEESVALLEAEPDAAKAKAFEQLDLVEQAEAAAGHPLHKGQPLFNVAVAESARSLEGARGWFVAAYIEDARLESLAPLDTPAAIMLTVVYRYTRTDLQRVAEWAGKKPADDPAHGEDGLRSLAASTVRRGSRPTLHRFRSTDEEVSWVVEELRDDDDLDSMAILVPTNTRVDDWVGRLKAANVSHVRLAAYTGRPTPGVKIGTYARAKGLEFKRVFLPGLDDGKFPWGARGDADGMLLQGSMLYVAMSRARDRLDISCSGVPSYFLGSLVDLLDEGSKS